MVREAEEGKRTRGRPFKDAELSESDFRKDALKVLKALVKSLEEKSKSRVLEVARYFIPMQGQPQSEGIEKAVNELLQKYPEAGWYPLHVSSQEATLDLGAGIMKGDQLLILFAHD